MMKAIPSFLQRLLKRTGKRQSPIDIDVNCAVKTPTKPIIWGEYYAETPESLTLELGTCGVKIIPVYKDNKKATIMGGPLAQPYELKQFHFHWASNEKGSEHTVNGNHYAMELHAVHFLKDYTQERALADPEGIAAISYFIDISKSPKECIQRLDEVIKLVSSGKSKKTMSLTETFPLSDIIKPFTSDYYYYNGSLTTPPYMENVSWIISPQILKFPGECLTSFRKFAGTNRRDIQELADRTVLSAIETCN